MEIPLEQLDLFHGTEVLFPEYFESISRIFIPCHGQHFHTMASDKTMEIGFSNLQYFQNISIPWKRSNSASVPANTEVLFEEKEKKERSEQKRISQIK